MILVTGFHGPSEFEDGQTRGPLLWNKELRLYASMHKYGGMYAPADDLL